MITRRQALFLVVISLASFFLFYLAHNKYKWMVKKDVKALDDYRILIEDISETVIPSTDTPGAREARVVDYILNVLENCTSERDRKTVLSGLDDLEKYCTKKYSLPFYMLTAENKEAILRYFEKKWVMPTALLNKIRRKIIGPTFFEQMKWLIVSGYCTSELGATKGLAYDHIPEDYISCAPYKPLQRAWATS